MSAVPQVWWDFPPSLASLYRIWLAITKHALVQNGPFWFQSGRVSSEGLVLRLSISFAAVCRFLLLMRQTYPERC